MTLSIHREAQSDLAHAIRFYKNNASKSVATRFLDEFERVPGLLDENPGLGTRTNVDRRTYPLRGFPYSLIYKVADGGIRILVVRHQSRDPAIDVGRE